MNRPTGPETDPDADGTRRLFLKMSGTGLLALSAGCVSDADDIQTTPNDSGEPGSGGTDSGWPGGSDSGTPYDTEGWGPGDTGSSSGDTGSSSGDTGSSSGDSGTSSPGDTAPEVCDETPEDIEGPYYVENAPERTTLDIYGDSGTSLAFTGFLLDPDCRPIPDAIIEIWHANPSGDYDNDSPQKRYRGYVRTSKDGAYGFVTLLPGRYLNGSQYRPMHIHVKIWVKGTEKLVTQLYFEGDPYNKVDDWYNPLTELPLTEDADGNITSTYDFVVDP